MTDSDQIRPSGVSDRQSIAIDALISGVTHREAAEKAGVQRTTVTAWCNHNVIFISEWNQRRKERLITVGERLHEATGAALEVLIESLSAGDVKTAMALIRVVGVEHLLRATRPGATNPLRVTADLAANLKSDLIGEMFIEEEISLMIEHASEASVN